MVFSKVRTEFWNPATYTRNSVQEWLGVDRPDVRRLADERSNALLAEYEEPEIDPAIRARIKAFVEEQMES